METVYYTGTEEQWNNIKIDYYCNGVLLNANMIFSYSCEHLTTELRNALEATCTTDGYTGDICCVDCGKIIEKGTVIPHTGHDYISAVTKEPACTTDGVETYTCSLCGDTYTVPIPATGHVHSTLDESTVIAPTCTKDGYTGDYKCDVCSAVTQKGSVVNKLGHDYVAVSITDPTCTEQGYTTYTCSRCYDSYNDNYVPSAGHSFGEWTVRTEPTCEKTGLEYRECSVCQHEETRVLDALGHDYSSEWTIDKAATCTEEGSKSHHCSRCDSKADVTVIPA